MEFQTAEEELRNTFLPALFNGATSHIPGRAVTGLPVNQAGIALPEPTQTTGANRTASCVITGKLVAALRGMAEFRAGDHYLLMGEVGDEISRRHAKGAETALGAARAAASKADGCRMGRIVWTGH